MLQIIKKILLGIVDRIDSGNSNINYEDQEKIIEALRQYTDREVRLSKYQACEYLNMSRASFDNYIRSGKLPQGLKIIGFKEKFWTKRVLDTFIETYRKSKK